MPSINKVVYGNRTLLDLTSDTVTPGTMLSGATAHSASGESITGTFAVEPNKIVTLSSSGIITPSVLYTDYVQSNITNSTTYARLLHTYNRGTSRIMSSSVDDYYYPQTNTSSETITLTTGTTYRIYGTFTAIRVNHGLDTWTSTIGKITVDDTFTWNGTSYELSDPFTSTSDSTKVSKITIESTSGNYKFKVYWTLDQDERYSYALIAADVDFTNSSTFTVNSTVTIAQASNSTYNAMAQVTVNVSGGSGGITLPEFTVTFSNGTPVSVTTTWSYSDCEDFISDYDNEYMHTALVQYDGYSSDPQTFVATATLYMGQINYVVFTDSAPYADIAFMYKSNGTFEFYTPFEALTLTATQNGTYTTGYSNKFYDEVIVNVSGGSPTIQSLTVTPTTSQQTFNASGVDGYKPVTVNAMPSGTATAPTSISGTSASVSTGTNTLTLTKSVSVTPRITTAGYVSSGTAGNSSVSLTASVTTKAAATITPNTSAQTIPSGTYLTGTQTIAGDANLVGSNIISGKSIFGVSGTVVINKYYTGSTDPAASLGSDGDIYLKVAS